jgi:hypothetical protein
MNLAKGLGLLVVVVASVATGCTIHLQQPVKEVAYDFSDRDFYDRAYAPSPAYEARTPEIAPLYPRRADLERSLAVGRARGLALPNAAAFSVATPGPTGLELEPAFERDSY